MGQVSTSFQGEARGAAPNEHRAGISDQNEPLVSVVIPAYNAQPTIADTLHSVRTQTYRNLEIIVVDDGSTDGTAAVVQQHQSEDNRITLLRQTNSGVAGARNLGWRTARSELVAFLDSDDLWAPTKLEKQVAVILAGGPAMGLVYTWWCVINEQNQIKLDVPGRYFQGHVLEQTLLGNFIGHASSPLVRQQALQEVGGYQSSLRETGVHGCEDLQLYQRIAARYQYGLVPEYLTGYRIATTRMSSDRIRMFCSFEKVAEESRRLHPEFAGQIDRGVRYYMIHLVREATAALEFRQAWSLFSRWVARHALDAVLLPIAMLRTAHFRGVYRFAAARRFGRSVRYFPIGQLTSESDRVNSP